jgi:hypothetical protein
MALSGLERRIQYIQDEIEDVTHELEGHRRQFEMLRREVLNTRSLTYTPKAKSPPKSPTTPKKSKKKSMDLRMSILRRSPGVREYEYRKKQEEERLKELELRRREETERREFEIRKEHRLAELEELGQTSKLAIGMLEFRLAELVEEYERLTLPRSKGETTGRGRKTNRELSKKLSKKNKKNKI